MARSAVLCALVSAAQAFAPGPVPGCLAGLSKVPATTGAQGVAAPLGRGGLHPGRLPRRVLALRMSDPAKEKEMEELLKKRVELLKEKEELLRERKEISSQSNAAPVPEMKRPSPPANRAEEMISSANGNIFQVSLARVNRHTVMSGVQLAHSLVRESKSGAGLLTRRVSCRAIFRSFAAHVFARARVRPPVAVCVCVRYGPRSSRVFAGPKAGICPHPSSPAVTVRDCFFSPQ